MKEREKPIKLRKLEALLRRLPKSHSRYPLIEQDYLKQQAGYKGEKSIDYYLTYIQEKYHILNNIRLLNKMHYFQIDTLVITPYFICIIEIKNIAGTLYFDLENDQLIRMLDGKEEGFHSPLIQIKRQQEHLENWLKDLQFPQIPVHSIVVISSPTTIIKSSKPLNSKVIHSSNLPTLFQKLENNYKKAFFSKQVLMKCSDQILDEHEEEDTDLIEQYQVAKEDILSGVQCPDCGHLPALRLNGIWKCTSCRYASRNTHITALEDYRLLFGQKITTEQLRLFLRISSRTSAFRVIRRLDYHFIGNTKNRIYYIKNEDIRYL